MFKNADNHFYFFNFVFLKRGILLGIILVLNSY